MTAENPGYDKPSLRDHGGRYSFICEVGHRIVSDSHNLDRCPARGVNVQNGVTEFTTPECGADIDYRVIPYEAMP